MFDISHFLSYLSWGHSVNSPILSTKDEHVPSLPHSLRSSDEIGCLKGRERRLAPHSAENPGSRQSKHGCLPACVRVPPRAQSVLVMERGLGGPRVHTLCVDQVKAGTRDSQPVPTRHPPRLPRCLLFSMCPPPLSAHLDPAATSNWTRALEGPFRNVFEHAGAAGDLRVSSPTASLLSLCPVLLSQTTDGGSGFLSCDPSQ